MTYSSGELDFSRMEASDRQGSADLNARLSCLLQARTEEPRLRLSGMLRARSKQVGSSVLNDLFNAGQDMEGLCSGEFRIADDGSGLKWSADSVSGWCQMASVQV